MYSIEWIGNNVIVRLKDHIDFKEIDTADGLLYGDLRFEKMDYQIFDMTDVEKFDISERDMQVIGAMDKNSSSWNKKMKVALVSKDQSIIKLIDIYKRAMESTDWLVKIFPDIDEAKKWCEVLPSNGES